MAYLATVTVAPITSTIRGVPSEVVLNEEDGRLMLKQFVAHVRPKFVCNVEERIPGYLLSPPRH
jgi:hypothetical protein